MSPTILKFPKYERQNSISSRNSKKAKHKLKNVGTSKSRRNSGLSVRSKDIGDDEIKEEKGTSFSLADEKTQRVTWS